MTWQELKDRVEAIGVLGDMQIYFINILGSHTGIELTYDQSGGRASGLAMVSNMADGDVVLEPGA